MQIEESHFYHLLNAFLSDKATSSEKKELEEIIQNHEEFRLLFHLFVKEASEADDFSDQEALLAYHKHQSRMADHEVMDFQPRKIETISRYRKWINTGVAASVLLFLGYFYIQNRGADDILVESQYEVSTTKGQQKSFYLADSTHIWLNGGSKLVIQKGFGKEDREVTLIGEAYFDVAKNKDMPFVIHAGGTSVKVLGTSFNLRAYPDEQKVETTLVEGKVEVHLNSESSEKILLSPGQKLSVNLRQPSLNSSLSTDLETELELNPQPVVISKINLNETDNTAIDALWLKNVLVFDAEQLPQVASKLEKWYNVTVQIQNPALNDLVLSGSFEQRTIIKVLDALQATGSFQYTIKADTVYIN